MLSPRPERSKVPAQAVRRLECRVCGAQRELAEDVQAARDVLDLAEQAGLRVRTQLRATRAPEREILRQARAGDHDLIVMGVTRRAGDGAAFGPLAETVLEASDRSVLFLAS